MEWRRWFGGSLVSGAVLFAVGVAFHFVGPLVPGLDEEYRNAALFRPWSGWTGIYMIAHPWLYGAIFAAVFLGARALVGKAHLGGARAGLLYGLAAFLAGSFPVFALNFASLQVSAGIILMWTLQSLCQYSLAGLALGWYCPRGGA